MVNRRLALPPKPSLSIVILPIPQILKNSHKIIQISPSPSLRILKETATKTIDHFEENIEVTIGVDTTSRCSENVWVGG